MVHASTRYTGEALFQTHDNLEHMALMEAVLDKSMPKVSASIREYDSDALQRCGEVLTEVLTAPQHLVRSARGSRNDRHACKYFHKDRDRLYWPKVRAALRGCHSDEVLWRGADASPRCCCRRCCHCCC